MTKVITDIARVLNEATEKKPSMQYFEFQKIVGSEIKKIETTVSAAEGITITPPWSVLHFHAEDDYAFEYDDDGSYVSEALRVFVPRNFNTMDDATFFEACRKRVATISRRFGLINPLLQSNFIKNKAGGVDLGRVLHTLSDRDAKNWYKEHALPNRNEDGYFGVMKGGSSKVTNKIKVTYSFFIPFSEQAKFEGKSLGTGYKRMYEIFKFECV